MDSLVKKNVGVNNGVGKVYLVNDVSVREFDIETSDFHVGGVVAADFVPTNDGGGVKNAGADGSKQTKVVSGIDQKCTSDESKPIDNVLYTVETCNDDAMAGGAVKGYHGSLCNEGTKSYANLFNSGNSQASNEVRQNMGGVSDMNKVRSDGGVNVSKKLKFRTLVNEERVENADTVLPMSAIEKVKNRFENTLVGFFIGKSVAFTIVQNYVNNTWAKFGLQKLMKNDDGVFLFKFASKDGLERVLERGPWIIRNTPLILNRWTPNVSLKRGEVNKVPIWIKLYNVPVVAYSPDGLSLIATQVGKPIVLDAFTSSMCENAWGRISFARALVEISSDFGLKHEVSMAIPLEDGSGHTREVIKVEYQWKPPHCVDCKIFGHTNEKCPKRVTIMETPTENKDGDTSSTTSTHSDGFTEVRRKKTKGKKAYQQSSRQIDGIRLNKPKPNFFWQKKGSNMKGANTDNSSQINKVSCPFTSNSFDALNNMEEGVSSSRNIQEDDHETRPNIMERGARVR
ncbi:ribonuclease H-like domain-containing protein [Tanacetum coccineum]